MNEHLIHFIDIASYRLDKALQGAEENFMDFEPGKGVRGPREIMEHLIEVTFYGLRILKVDETKEAGDCHTIVCANLKIMKEYLANETYEENTVEQLINGPLSDLLAHIGQLAMLRRLSGDPIVWENYALAKIPVSHAV